MNIYQYVNSKAIREHLRKINYKFNSKEAIWLVYQNHNLTFNQKCSVWEEIMLNMGDITYTNKKCDKKDLTIFSILKDYIKYHMNTLKDKNNSYIHDVILYFFEDMWFNFPVPFKEGDIVYDPRNKEIGKLNSGPFVFLHTGDRGSDITDMTAYGYFVWEDGNIYWECMHAYMNLEYYEDEITGSVRPLLLISNFLKGKIDISLCLKAYHYILIDELHKKDVNSFNYTNEGLELAGLKELIKKG